MGAGSAHYASTTDIKNMQGGPVLVIYPPPSAALARGACRSVGMKFCSAVTNATGRGRLRANKARDLRRGSGGRMAGASSAKGDRGSRGGLRHQCASDRLHDEVVLHASA